MSHTSTIDSVVIADEQALRATITELKANGVDCDLLQNAVPRAYYASQQGLGQAKYVVRLNKAKYDVGLYDREDGKGMEARADFYGDSIANQLGVAAQEGESAEQASMGKLFQTYAVTAATRKAVQQGYSVNRVTKQDGTVQLQIAV